MAANRESSKENAVKTNDNNNFLVNTLDELEKRVEELRDNAKQMQEEKKTLLSSLNTMLQSQALVEVSEAEREELELFIDRLTKRCLTIEVSVLTLRSNSQEKSLQTVLHYLQELIGQIHRNMTQSRDVIERYLNSCLTETKGPVDDKFQAALLGCTAEDQKDVKKRLEVLQTSIDRAEAAIPSATKAVKDVKI